MKKSKQAKKSGALRLSGLLDVPLDIVADVPRITINDNREMIVENYTCIEGYEQEQIRLRSKDYRITISGKELQIITITDEEILIQGTIQNVSLL